MYTSPLSSPRCMQSCLCVSPSLNIWVLRVVWPVKIPTTILSFCLLIAWRSFVPHNRGSLITVGLATTSTGFPTVQVLLSQVTPLASLATTKGMPTVWSEVNPWPHLTNIFLQCTMIVMNKEEWDRRRIFNLKGDILQRIWSICLLHETHAPHKYSSSD